MAFKILVVDDEPDLEELMRQRFRKEIKEKRFEFVFAANGAEALEVIGRDRAIDLVLSDINMPVMDGLTLLSNLPQAAPMLRAVVVSAYGDMDNIRAAMNRGAFDFVTKPVDFTDLQVTIDKSMRELKVLKDAIGARDQLVGIRREIDIAAQIQKSLLPRKGDPVAKGRSYEVVGEMIPARDVGGDFFDYFKVDETRLGFVIADVSGKGIAAAFFMAVSRTLLRAIAQRGIGPGECLRQVNDVLCDYSDSRMFVTMCYGILNTETGAVEYCAAGHQPPYVLGADGVRALAGTGGLVLGMMEDLEYASASATLQPGDSLLLYTDGVSEAMNLAAELWSDERLEAYLPEVVGKSGNDITSGIVAKVQEFAGEAPQADDITILVLTYTGGTN